MEFLQPIQDFAMFCEKERGKNAVCILKLSILIPILRRCDTNVFLKHAAKIRAAIKVQGIGNAFYGIAASP